MKIRGPLAWFTENHVTSNLLMLVLLFSGTMALLNIKIEVFPELDPGMINVTVPYLGASPAEVEEGICIKVEEAISGIDGIERIRSVALEGQGVVTAELEEDVDVKDVQDEIKAAVDRIITFPVETEKPVVADTLVRRRVITIVLYGEVSERTLKNLAEHIRDDLTALNNITQVDVEGVHKYEISIEVSEENLQKYGLSFARVADAVRRASLDMPGGSVKTNQGEILLRTKGQRYRGGEFESILILTRPDGTQLHLSDVASVVDGFEESDNITRFNGQPAVMVKVYRVGKQGVLDIVDTIETYLEEKEPQLPAGVSLATWQDDSKILRSRISLLVRNARLGLLLVFICLALFLDLRLAFWVTMGIPISFMGGFFLIHQMGVSINMISLFAFIVSLGIVVDDAIVVGENTFTYLKQGMKPLEAAIRGIQEMAIPITIAVLTTVVAFLPLVFVEGNMGQVMGQIAIVVLAILLVSLVEALLILPAHLAASRYKKVPAWIERTQGRVQEGLEWFIHQVYAPFLSKSLRFRYATVAAALGIFLLTISFVAGHHIKFTFMPKIDADNMVAALTMPQGTPVEQTAAIVRRLEKAAEQVRQEFDAERKEDTPSVIQNISSTIGVQPSKTVARGPAHGPAAVAGLGSSHLAEVNVELLSSEERGTSSVVIANRWRSLVGEIPGASSLTFTAALFSAGESVNVELAHTNFDTLLKAVDRLKQALSEYSGVTDIEDSFLPGKRELQLAISPAGRASGLTLVDLARQVRQGFYGEEAQRIQRGRDDIRVMVRYPRKERQSQQDIENMHIRLPDGTFVPFRTVANVTEGRGYASINRTDRRRVVSVTADVDEENVNANEINEQLRASVLPQMKKDFPGLTFSFEGAQRQQKDAMGSLVINFLFALFAIFALLAVPLKRYTQPLIIMSAIPFGTVGAIIGHIIMGIDLTLLSMFGIVAVTGIVVNDSLILVHLINKELESGRRLATVIRESGIRRFRPILLTSLTTFFGLTPMILETSLQARFLIPMATSLAFGVLFATGITLILVPNLYAIREDIMRKVSGNVRADTLPGEAIPEY